MLSGVKYQIFAQGIACEIPGQIQVAPINAFGFGFDLTNVRIGIRIQLISGAEMGKYEIRDTCRLGEAGHLGSGAVLRPGADPVRDFLCVGCLMDHHLNISARFQKQVGLIVVTGDDDFARFSGNLGVVSSVVLINTFFPVRLWRTRKKNIFL